jgi:hypothetical protein
MKVSSTRVVGLIALTWCVSCGSPAVPRPAVAPLAIGPSVPARPASPPPPEASPEAPADLALLVRINDGRQLMRELSTLLPPGAASAATLLDPGQLLPLLLGRRLADVVDLGQPVDMTSLGMASPSFVLSMAVKPEADGRLGEGRALREEGGLLHVEPDGAQLAAAQLRACAFTPAAGRARTRLVCASDRASLESAALYLARTVAAEPLEVDVRITVPGTVLRERRDSTARAMSDAASARLGDGLVESFLAEIERVDVDLRFLGSDLELGVSMHLSARESMLARALVPRSKPAPPPAAFDRLPADTLFALHTTGALPDDLAPLKRAVADTVESTLVRDGYGTAETRALRERFESLLLTGGPLVVGIGVRGGGDGAEQALARLASPASGPPAPPAKGTRGAPPRHSADAALELQARKALQPWLLLEVDEPAEKWTRGLRELVRGAEDAERTRRPGSHASTPRDPDGDHVDLKIGALDPALELPTGSLHLEARITPRTKGKRPPRTSHVFVVPKGGATWIGYSADASAIASRLRRAIDDASDAGTLGRTAGATALRARPALAAGLVSLLGLRYLSLKTTTEELQRAARVTTRIAALGVRGPESVSWTATADTAPGTNGLSIRAVVTRQTVGDVVRILGL